jgi:16S rRNA (cytidine1402-2'-O)-methyltransferase
MSRNRNLVYVLAMRALPAHAPERPAAAGFVAAGHQMPAARPAAGLYLVATPIGNLGDITLRALETLAGVDLIACEDTRVTRKLTERFAIATPLVAYHEHNAAVMRPKLIARLNEGAAIALVSDAGTPLISDPGFKLAREAAHLGLAVTALPGPSAVLAALAVAGLPTDRFFFEGFLPPKTTARRARIAALSGIEATLVLFEAGPRVGATLTDLAAILGEREAAVCRELTKLHEEVRRASLPALAEAASQLETRGEFVLVIAPPLPAARVMADADLDALLQERLRHGSVKDAVASVLALSGRPRREVYARALRLARLPGEADES